MINHLNLNLLDHLYRYLSASDFLKLTWVSSWLFMERSSFARLDIDRYDYLKLDYCKDIPPTIKNYKRILWIVDDIFNLKTDLFIYTREKRITDKTLKNIPNMICSGCTFYVSPNTRLHNVSIIYPKNDLRNISYVHKLHIYCYREGFILPKEVDTLIIDNIYGANVPNVNQNKLHITSAYGDFNVDCFPHEIKIRSTALPNLNFCKNAFRFDLGTNFRVKDFDVFDHLKYATFTDCKFLTDISFLRNIYSVEIISCMGLKDISCLSDCYSVYIENCFNVTCINSLRNVHTLKLINICRVDDFSNLDNIHTLHIETCKQNFKGQDKLKNVFDLRITKCEIHHFLI